MLQLLGTADLSGIAPFIVPTQCYQGRTQQWAWLVLQHPRPPKKRKPSASGTSFSDWIGGTCCPHTLQVWFPAHWAPVVLQQLQQKAWFLWLSSCLLRYWLGFYLNWQLMTTVSLSLTFKQLHLVHNNICSKPLFSMLTSWAAQASLEFAREIEQSSRWNGVLHWDALSGLPRIDLPGCWPYFEMPL